MVLKIICIEEPDISYTRNKKLVVNETYWGTYIEEKLLGDHGICPIYDVYDDKKNKLGQYYARDFITLEEYRDKKIEQILGL
jgi:hypothetical protein